MGNTFWYVWFMSWQICELMKARKNFIEDYGGGKLSMTELCRRHGISRKTGYKWLKRFELGGEKGLEDESRQPFLSPHKSNESVEAAVLAVRAEHPCWGGRKIRRVLINEGLAVEEAPAASTVSNILRRHGKLGVGTREGAVAYKRFERGEPNELWQMDFKGHFGMDGGARCFPLTVLDDHSRYNLVLEACPGENTGVVKPLLERTFRRYGMPRQILCDHGNPWGKGLNEHGQPQGTPELVIWLARLGVEVIHGRVRHPQTQGKEERFHRTLKAEVLKSEDLWRDLAHCQKAFDSWREVYNMKRPHEALALETPYSRYQLSPRAYPDSLPAAESFYLDDDELRRVKSKGEITFRNRFFGIGNGYRGEVLALRRVGEESWEVYHCARKLGTVDLSLPAKKKGSYHPIK